MIRYNRNVNKADQTDNTQSKPYRICDFAGTLPLPKGMLRPLGTPASGSRQQAGGQKKIAMNAEGVR